VRCARPGCIERVEEHWKTYPYCSRVCDWIAMEEVRNRVRGIEIRDGARWYVGPTLSHPRKPRKPRVRRSRA